MQHIKTFPLFSFIYEDQNGRVITQFGDGCSSVTDINNDDIFHAHLLHIQPKEHRLLHEVTHHIVAICAYNEPYCPIIWKAAHSITQAADAQEREWLITAISYFSLRVNMRHSHEWKAIMQLHDKINVYELAAAVLELFVLMRTI